MRKSGRARQAPTGPLASTSHDESTTSRGEGKAFEGGSSERVSFRSRQRAEKEEKEKRTESWR